MPSSEGYLGLPAYYVQSSDPLTPNFGLSLKGMDPIVGNNFAIIDTNMVASPGGVGFGNAASPGQVNQIVVNGNFPGSPFGRSVVDIGQSWTAQAPGDALGVGLSVGLAVAFPSASVVFGIASEIACPSSYSGTLPAELVAVNAEVDHNGSGNMPMVSCGNFQVFNNANGSIGTAYGNFVFVQNFGSGSWTQAYGVFSSVNNRGGSTMGLDVAGYFRSGVSSGTNTTDYTIQIDAPLTGGVFTNPHVGLRIEDQTGAGANAFAIQIAKGLVDFGTGNNGFGNGSAGTSVTTTAHGTGTGPTTPQTVVQYLKVTVNGATYWIPLMQ